MVQPIWNTVASVLWVNPVCILYDIDLQGRDERQHHGKDVITKSRRFNNLYVSGVVLVSLVMIYFLFSLFACAHYHKRDTQIINTYRKRNKKVKDMSKSQKKQYDQHRHAKERMTLFACGCFMAPVKIMTILSAISAFFLYPYVKQKKTNSLFILFSVLLSPSLFMFSITTVFLIANSRTNYYY